MEARPAFDIAACVATALCFAAAPAFGAPVEEELIGTDVSMDVRALGMAGATVSRARGVDAILTNPAGLGALLESEVAVSGVYASTEVETRFGRWTTDDSRSNTRLGQIGIAFQSQSVPGLGLGIAVNQVRDLNRPFLIDGTESGGEFSGFDLVEDREARGDVYSYSFGAGVEVSPGVRLGLAADRWEGDSDRAGRLDRQDAAQVDPTLSGVVFDDEVQRTIEATRVRLGVELGLVPELTIGGTVLLPSDVDIRERWRESTRIVLEDGSIDRESNPPSSGVTDFTLHLPAELQAGVTVRVDRLRISSSFRYVDWRNAEYSRAPAGNVSRTQFEDNYDDALEGRIGIEWRFGEDIALRAGMRVGSTPIEWKEVVSDPTVLSVGLTTPLTPGVLGDVAYVRTTWDREDSELSEKFTSDQVVAGARVVF